MEVATGGEAPSPGDRTTLLGRGTGEDPPPPSDLGPGRVLAEGHNTLHQRIIKAMCLPGEPTGSESLSSGSLG